MMHRQVIKHHNVFGLQLRDQSMTDIRIKDHRINGTFNREWREQSAHTQTPDQRDSPAVIARHALIDSRASRRTPIGSGHRQMKARFVGKDETATIQASDPLTKSLSVGFDPFGCRKTFFYAADPTSG